MSRVAKIQPEQIKNVKKILQALPVKETAKSKQEAALQLAKDFQAALKKGYSPKDICDLLKKEGIVISASMVTSRLPTKRKGASKSQVG